MRGRVRPKSSVLSEASQIVNDALTKAEQQLQMSQEVVVALGWAEKDFVVRKMDGVSGHAQYSNVLDIDFNSKPDKWKKSLIATAFHEYAHVWDYEQRGQQWEKRWQYILGESLAQHFAAKNAEYESPWRTKYQVGEVAKYWSEIRDEEIDQKHSQTNYDPIFINRGDGEYPNWLGYSLAWQIGERLLQNHSLKDFPGLGKEDLIDMGNKLYNQKS